MDGTSNQADLIAQQDAQRTARSFIGFLSTAMGLDNQAAGVDGVANNTPYRYQVIGPVGVGVEGAPVSTAQGLHSAAGMSPLLLVALGLAAYLVLPKLLRG